MVDGDPRNLRDTGESCNRLQLINDNRVDDVGGNADGVADLSGKDAAEVRCVISLGRMVQIVQERIRHSVGAAGDRAEKAASSDADVDGGERDVLLLQGIEDQLLSEVLLRIDVSELADLLGGVAQGLVEDLGLVVEDTDLGGGGTGIDDKASDCHDFPSF